ncbi:YheT family hydrolase [Tundrisphaera lichenicola]|uniref:YheT family hydrolase n=1 Tax=Tundrisphaera lichenicola TaxID=2029860 RepID=UPI003EBC8D6F
MPTAIDDPSSSDIDKMGDRVPPFEAHPWVTNPHIQTILARFWTWPRPKLPSTYYEVEAGGGDRLSVLESIPEGWSSPDPSVLMVHGLAGCARSPYVVRVARKLVDRGARVVRMNLRNAGSSFGLSRSFYHGGKTDDLRAVAEWLSNRAPSSPIALIGFSLGANLVLKLASEAADRPVEGLDCLVAANPPLDLNASCRRILEPANRLYDRNFLRGLRAEVARLHDTFPDLGPIDLGTARSLMDFDEIYTAPRNGFLNAIDYYSRSSSKATIHKIQIPGLVIHAEDDPFIPVEPFHSASFPEQLALELIPRGGHLGYLSHRPFYGDRRWLDARIIVWLVSRWGSSVRKRPASSR